ERFDLIAELACQVAQDLDVDSDPCTLHLGQDPCERQLDLFIKSTQTVLLQAIGEGLPQLFNRGEVNSNEACRFVDGLVRKAFARRLALRMAGDIVPKGQIIEGVASLPRGT